MFDESPIKLFSDIVGIEHAPDYTCTLSSSQSKDDELSKVPLLKQYQATKSYMAASSGWFIDHPSTLVRIHSKISKVGWVSDFMLFVLELLTLRACEGLLVYRLGSKNKLLKSRELRSFDYQTLDFIMPDESDFDKLSYVFFE